MISKELEVCQESQVRMESVLHFIKFDRIAWPAVALFLGGLLWVLSLTQVVFYTSEDNVMGIWVLLTGWMGFAMFQFAWYANLLALLGLLLMYRQPNRAMALAVAAVLLAGQAFWFDTIPNETSSVPVLDLGLGFWFWYASMVLITLGIIFDSGDREAYMAEEDSPVVEPANPDETQPLEKES